MSWEVLCILRVKGGLEIHRLRDFNISLLSKCWWKLLSNHQFPWVIIIVNINHSIFKTSSQGVYLHSGEGFFEQLLHSNVVSDFATVKVTSVKFWKDCWIGEVSLSYTLPTLVEMANERCVGSLTATR